MRSGAVMNGDVISDVRGEDVISCDKLCER